MKLIIFDLDQTLVDFIAFHDEAVLRLFTTYFGVEARLTDIDFAGRSLGESLTELARLKNVPEDEFNRKLVEMLEKYDEHFEKSTPEDSSAHVLPGARELLQKLSQTDNFVVLYSGSSGRIVRRALKTSGLGKYFKFVIGGNDAENRVEMVRMAIKRAEQMAGRSFNSKDIVIIGDSVRDVDCGKVFNALTIAVATGFHSEEELMKRKPDYLFKSLRSYKPILKAISQ